VATVISRKAFQKDPTFEEVPFWTLDGYLQVPFMGFVLLTHGKPGLLVGVIAGNSRLLAFGVLAPLNLNLA
jgi:hypothetical protein